MEGFEYVVNPIPTPKVAFGSGVPRETMPLEGAGLSSFMRRNQSEVRRFPGPKEYYVPLSWVKKGCGCPMGTNAFTSTVNRFPPEKVSGFPTIGQYDVEPKKPFKRARHPFGSSLPRMSTRPKSPRTEFCNLRNKIPTDCRIDMAFGKKRIPYPAVPVECTAVNMAICKNCGKTPVGDYWKDFATNLIICRPCRTKEYKYLKKCGTDRAVVAVKLREFRKYTLARHCAFYHVHINNKAKQIMPSAAFRYKLNTENYLCRYIKA